MEHEIRKVTLGNLLDGAAEELFGAAFMNALENMEDPNTPQKQKRKVVLTLEMVPNEARDAAAISLKCETKLASFTPVANFVRLGRHNGQVVAVEALKQTDMFTSPAGKPSSVIKGGAN